jgi:hypothetical protein
MRTTTLSRGLAATALAAAAVGLSLNATAASATPARANTAAAISHANRASYSPYDVWIGDECRGDLWIENPYQDYVQGYVATLPPSEGGTAGNWVQCQGRVQISYNYGRSWRTVWDRTTDVNNYWALSPRYWDGPGVRARFCVTEKDWGFNTATRCTANW